MEGGPIPLLLALADDDFMLGYRDSEWTGIAPMLEEDIAMSSISQDEIGHARVLYEIAAERLGKSVDELAYGRRFEEYRSCWLVERHRGDWALTTARRYLYETADDVRAESLTSSSFAPLAAVMQKIRREERYHLMHLTTWLQRMTSSGEARPRFLAAIEQLWPDALGFFEEIQGEEQLLAGGVMTASSSELRARWLERVGAAFTGCGVRLPDPDIPARTGGRRGARSHEFEALWTEMTEVYRLDPQASW